MRIIDLPYLPYIFLSILLGLPTVSFGNANPAAPKEQVICDSIEQQIDQIFAEITMNDPEIRPLAESLYEMARTYDCEALPKTMNLMGFIYYLKHELLKAKTILLEAESVLKQPGANQNAYLTNQSYLGLVYLLEPEKYRNAALYFNRSKKIAIAINYERGQLHASLNLGLVYFGLNALDKAEETLLEVTNLGIKLKDTVSIGYGHQNLAQVYLEQKKYAKALESADLAEGVWKSNQHVKGMYYIYLIKSNIYKSLGDLNNQILCINKALEFSNKVDVHINRGKAYLDLGVAFESNKDIASAKINYKKAISYAQNFSEEELNLAVSNLVALYAKENEIKEIEHLYKELISILGINKTQKKIEGDKWLENEENLDHQLVENTALKNAQFLNEERLKKIAIISGIAIWAIIFYIYIVTKEGKKRNELLEKIRLKNEELSTINQKLEESHSVIRHQNKLLESKNEELKDFAYVASHDLKAPIRTIKSFAGLLKRKLSPIESSEVKNIIGFIEKGSQNMSDLVTNLLEYTKIESQNLKCSTFDPGELVQEVILELHADINSEQATIEIGQLPEVIYADRTKFKQLFINLLSNALKFTAPDIQPKISVYTSESDNNFEFHIKDNGIGIEEKYQSKIFNMFQKLNAGHKYEGTGIGLATCAKAVSLHEGKIWVNSSIDKGSTFSFSLPKKVTSSNLEVA